ncbi:MAG: hypothetical protein SWK76_06210 [Actinomycetota bacterium]|nr:hypothetical protein [Actinomycetota bacterium]
MALLPSELGKLVMVMSFAGMASDALHHLAGSGLPVFLSALRCARVLSALRSLAK